MAKVTISIEINEADHAHAMEAFADAYDYDTNKLDKEKKDAFAVRMTKGYILDIANAYTKKLIDTAGDAQFKELKKDSI